MREYDPLGSSKRQYKRALLEMIRVAQLELERLEKDGEAFQPSEGISGIAFNLAKQQIMLSGVIEGRYGN